MKRILFIILVSFSFGLFMASCNSESKSSQLAKDEIYSCPMHPQIVKEEEGQCPICHMDLEKRKMTKAEMEKHNDTHSN